MKSFLLFAILCATLLSPVVLAQPACPGTLAHLLPHAGTYQTDQVLADSVVSASLRRLLGAKAEHVRRNVSVTGAVDLIACHLVIAGNAEHQGGMEQGIIAINLITGAVAAALTTGGRIEVFVEGSHGGRRL